MKRPVPPKKWPLKAAFLNFAILLPAALLLLSSCEPDPLVIPDVHIDGVYTVQEAQQADNYLLTLQKKPENPNRFTIENLANLIKNPLEGIVSGKKLVIYDQAFTNYLGDQYTISGEGEVINNTLYMRYKIEGYNGYAGSVFAKKQVDGK